MENLALQNLAMYTLEHGHDNLDIADAQRYINISLENAKFYNNRLRIIEISDCLPAIVDSYQAQLSDRNTNLRNTLFAISLLAVFLIAAIGFIFMQNNRLTQSRHKLQETNNRLFEMNKQQSNLNEQLHDLNEQLVKTNKKREGLVQLYIGLCSRYINRLKKQQTLVKRKINCLPSAFLRKMQLLFSRVLTVLFLISILLSRKNSTHSYSRTAKSCSPVQMA